MRNGNSRDTIALAGWLFADLLLGLGLLFFVAESRGTPPAPTPTVTSTATRTYTPTNTPTRFPTYTPYPTFTPIYTFTPYPTFTPQPPNLTYTPYPTFTPVPPEFTYTPYPTYTPFPPRATQTALPTYTPYPTSEIGLNGVPFVANLSLNPATVDALLGPAEGRAAARAAMRTQLRPQAQICLARFNDVARAGVALIFGSDPSPSVGNEIAARTADVLRELYPDIFGETVMKTYHHISTPAQSGDIEIELYFIGVTGEGSQPFTLADAVCNP